MLEKAKQSGMMSFFGRKEKKSFTQLIFQLTTQKNNSEDKLSKEKNSLTVEQDLTASIPNDEINEIVSVSRIIN